MAKGNRNHSGISIIILVLVIAVFLIPVVGLFVFELNKFQFIQQTLSKACDAAALAGGAKLVAAETTGLNLDERREDKHFQARAAAEAMMKQQVIQGVAMNGSALKILTSDLGPLTSAGLTPNECRMWAHMIDVNGNNVAFGAKEAKSIRVDAVFMESPAFLKHAGLTQIPVFAGAESGAPRLEIMLVLDLSGSMDDSTRVSLVQKAKEFTPEARAQYEEYLASNPMPQPPTDQDIENACGGPRPDPCVPIGPPPETRTNCDDWDGCRDQQCQEYQQAFQNWATPINNMIAENGNYFYKYNVVANGQLRKVFEDRGMTIGMAGTQINGLPHRHLTYASPPYQATTYPLPYLNAPEVNSCQGGVAGFTDLVVNLDDRLTDTTDPTEPAQPLFGLDAFPGNVASRTTSPAFDYSNIAELVEAARGTPDMNTAWGSLATKTAQQYPNCTFGGSAAKAAYEKDSQYYLQPAATVINASKAFIEALAESGRNIKCGVEAYDEVVAEPPPDDDPDTETAFENVSTATVTSAGEPDRQLDLVGLVPLDKPEAVTLLEDKLKTMYSLRGTDIASSIARARTLFPTGSGRAVKRVIVLFTDGQKGVDEPDPIPEATACRAAGISIFAIGLAQNEAIHTAMSNPSTGLPALVNAAAKGGIFISPASAADVKKSFLMVARRLVKLQQ